MIGVANGRKVGITGLGVHVPERILDNHELSTLVDTTDEWIMARTGIRERRIAAADEALTDIARPAAIAALEAASVEPRDIDLLVCATVTPDMMFPTSSALLADELGAPDAAAYDLLADWTDRSTLVLFGDGAGAVVLEPVAKGGFLGFELGADGGGGEHLWLPGSGSRRSDEPDSFVQMNGREVFKFATRVMIYSAERLLEECGRTIEDVDVYVPHQANVRIIDYATKKLGFPKEKVVVNVDRYGNTSSGSIPLALADGAASGLIQPGSLVLMTGMGAGLTWGSALIEWTDEVRRQ